MKKVAFTWGFAFFAIGLFAQTSSIPASNHTKASPASVSTAKTAPATATPMAKPSTQVTAGKPAVKKHRRHHKAKSTAPTGSTAPGATSPKAKKQ
ncbi:MAG: hypothetical protein H7246_04480 [Phycisphaerae bacterium]|nr:hypothetical protein [Saprospiraceae bacterium]